MDQQSQINAVDSSSSSAIDAAFATKQETEKPATISREASLSLSDLKFLLFDANANRIVWHGERQLEFEASACLYEASLERAIRFLSKMDQRQLVSMMQEAVLKGESGPFAFGVMQPMPPLSLKALRYESDDGRPLILVHQADRPLGETPGDTVMGVAPLIRCFVDEINKAVLVTDSFGFIRFVNTLFCQTFNIDDPANILGRGIAHIQNRVGKTLVTVIMESMMRRAQASGARRFWGANNQAISLSYSLTPFRVVHGAGGIIFMADQPHDNFTANFEQIFAVLHRPTLLIDGGSRQLIAANLAARSTFGIEDQHIADIPVTDTLLHPKSFHQMVNQAHSGGDSEIPLTITGFKGRSKSVKVRCNWIDLSSKSELLMECLT